MKGRLKPCLIILSWILAAPLLAAEAEEQTLQSAFSIRWENDLFRSSDANYSSGISFALTRTEPGMLGGIWDRLGLGRGKMSSVYELTQLQFTPSDLNLSIPDPNDRPYAGLTYLAVTTHLQQDESLQSFKLLAGVVGPASGAEETQKATHRLLNRSLPQGWSHQLDNEPIINLLYEYRHKYRFIPRNTSLGIECIPMGGAFLGNYLIQAQSEVLCRIGNQLPDDFGTSSLRDIGYLPLPRGENTAPPWRMNAFVRGGAHLVIHNLTLDGNSFGHSRSVDKRLLVPTSEFGAALWTRGFMTTLSYHVWGREFSGQPMREGFGTLLLSFFF